MKKIILAFIIGLSCMIRVGAQETRSDLNDYLDAYIGTNAKGYLQPAANLLITNINTGVWDWANIPDKVYFRIKANGMMSIPDEKMKTFKGNKGMVKVGKPINAQISWDNYLKNFESVPREQIIDALTGSLLQIKPAYPLDLINHYADGQSRETFIKTGTIQIMSTPEYQMC